ncbi:MAG TPA: ribonuclease H-like domain-containing protein, partial [Methanobacteriaceae archaeon]|nr:ribonuclease H-like domain-containing protein [Methanobacteriaceae archaeon]
HHHMDLDIPQDHLDLLYPSRNKWKSDLPNCQLQTLEKHLFGIERVDDVPGYLVPEFYKTYLKEGNIGPLIPIIEHNREDVITLIRLLSLIQKES